MNTGQLHQYLKDRGVRPSPQRVAVMRYLIENPVHPTIEQIFSDLVAQMPTLSKTTVYNTLKLLEDKRVVSAITIDERCVRYDADMGSHAHFRCRKCGRIEDIPLSQGQIEGVNTADNFTAEDVHVYVRGLCAGCR